MNKEEFLSAITEIGSCEDDLKRRSLLTKISDEVSKIYDDNTNLNTTLNTVNESLNTTKQELTQAKEYNMQLWLRLDNQNTNETKPVDSTGIEKPVEEHKITLEDLFKEGE